MPGKMVVGPGTSGSAVSDLRSQITSLGPDLSQLPGHMWSTASHWSAAGHVTQILGCDWWIQQWQDLVKLVMVDIRA